MALLYYNFDFWGITTTNSSVASAIIDKYLRGCCWIWQSHAAQILGFKFQYYQRMEVTNPVPSSLFDLAALLVKENFVDLDSM